MKIVPGGERKRGADAHLWGLGWQHVVEAFGGTASACDPSPPATT